MKISLKLISVAILMMFYIAFSSCEKSGSSEIDPFNNGGNERNMLVVVSDLHLGADLDYAEFKLNMGAFEKLLLQIKSAPNVKELIIAGDLLDEWFVPATVNTYQGKDQADFVKRIATANKPVFDVLNNIIKEGNILVTYVPGNHDLTITAANIESVLPGINQARDEILGLGTYSPVARPEIAIEHSHRYDFFCAPDPFSNQDLAPGTILPPGYFYTRIGALCRLQKHPKPGDTLPSVSPNISGEASQDLLFRYWKIWGTAIGGFPVTNRFDEKIIQIGVNGFTGIYSINDLVPFQSVQGGLIDLNLFEGIQDNWEARQTHNHVAVHTATARSIDSLSSVTEMDHQADLQYFMNPDSDKRLVVFGHTHAPKITTSISHSGAKCVYVNSGTWIDKNPNKTTMNFVVITPQNDDASSLTLVKLYNFEKEVVTKMAENSLRF